jgi:hypothetical protein
MPRRASLVSKEVSDFLPADSGKGTRFRPTCGTVALCFTANVTAHAGAYLAFIVDNIDAAVDLASQHYFKPIHAPSTLDSGPNVGNKCVYMRDPDGFTIQFISIPSR